MKQSEGIMKTTRLGKTDLEISRTGIGGISITPSPIYEAVKAMQRALDLEVSFIDAPVGYEDNEDRFSEAILGRREYKLSTKTWADNKATALRR